MKSMKIIKNLEFATLAALAATLLFQTSITQAADNLPTFTKITTGPVVTDAEGSAGFAWLDADNDNFLDLYVPNLSFNTGSGLVLDSFYQNMQNGTFVKITTNAIATKFSSSLVGVVGDYDNDGDEDLFVAHTAGLGNDLYRNEGSGRFTRLTSVQAGSLVGDRGDSLDAAWADYDLDGFIDLFCGERGRPERDLHQKDGQRSGSRRRRPQAHRAVQLGGL
jgi:VCBS repeat protein